MKCPVCWQAELVVGSTSVPLERDEIKYVIHHVPARLCPACGEVYLEQQVAEILLLKAVEISETGILESVIEYNTLA